MCETKNSASVSLIGKLKSIEEIKNKKLSGEKKSLKSQTYYLEDVVAEVVVVTEVVGVEEVLKKYNLFMC